MPATYSVYVHYRDCFCYRFTDTEDEVFKFLERMDFVKEASLCNGEFLDPRWKSTPEGLWYSSYDFEAWVYPA